MPGGGSRLDAHHPPRKGDLSNFGKIATSTPITFGPSSVFGGKKEVRGREESFSFSTSISKPSRKTSVGLTQSGGTPEPSQHRKLQLLPRSKALEETNTEASAPAGLDPGSEDGDVGTTASPMSEEAATNNISEDVKEFFSNRMLDAAESYFSSLPEEYHPQLVDRLTMTAIESREADAQLVADLFAQAREKDLCSPASFETGFVPLAGLLDDIAIDAPRAFNLFVIMMKGAGLDQDEERRSRIVEKSMDKDKLIALLT